jgi:hypothetical protein
MISMISKPQEDVAMNMYEVWRKAIQKDELRTVKTVYFQEYYI